MKKIFIMCASVIAMLTASNVNADCCPQPCAAPCDQACNECYCRYVHYVPCTTTKKVCVDENIPCTRKCYRSVPQYYQVECCRYVPEKYCVTKCRYVQECYDVPYTKCCKKTICIPQTHYVPRYYWKHSCGCN